jgi:hypothetical protein
MAKAVKILDPAETYTDANGNKVVQPVYNGTGGTVCGTIGVVK